MMHNASKSNMPTLTLLTNASYLESAEQEDEQAAVSAQTEQSQEQLSAGGVGGGPSVSNFYNGGLGLHNQQRGLAASGVGAGGAAGAGAGTTNYAHVVNGSVNLLLGGSMLCLVTTILCVVCYCCHRNIRKRTEAAYRQQQQQQQQQQHQWLENDPNLEIYSVEQCYESSGLFLGDSMEGLAALPALHHQPPPSYDVVLQEQQQQQQQQQQQLQLQLQQQQQQLLQRVSPPPGYRSTLDLGSLQQVAATAVASGSGSIDAVPPAAEVALHKQLQRSYNAQSCCSLQRAEVENMWQAAATSTAVPRSSNCLELDVYRASHRHLALKLSNHYKRGCPLCGKFRYAEDEALTASVESNWQPNEVNDNVATHISELLL
ncbi:s-cup [Drosophila busckii]|uniref:S-cup n=1 Tax=Drosophila busckii TaxID=30019 RepID=A0A0M4EF09_DROBS|nr:s-cup [Drosophila busckii]